MSREVGNVEPRLTDPCPTWCTDSWEARASGTKTADRAGDPDHRGRIYQVDPLDEDACVRVYRYQHIDALDDPLEVYPEKVMLEVLDYGSPSGAVWLDPNDARRVAAFLVRTADEIEGARA